MYIMNEKTSTAFVSGTAKISGGFQARVIRNKLNKTTGVLASQTLVFTANATSRWQAKALADHACHALVENHAFIN